MRNDHELDELINAALPGYSAAEPRPGLEQRVMAASVAVGRSPNRSFWGWALAIPVVACLLLFLLFATRHRPSSGFATAGLHASPATSAPDQPKLALQTPSPAIIKKPTLRGLTAGARKPPPALPKQDVFPTPTPLTPEETSLIALGSAGVQTAPPSTAATTDIDPIRIAELRIEPLSVPLLDSAPSPTVPISKDSPQ